MKLVYPTDRERSWAKVIDHLYRLATNYAHIEEMAVEDAATPDEVERSHNRHSYRPSRSCFICVRG